MLTLRDIGHCALTLVAVCGQAFGQATTQPAPAGQAAAPVAPIDADAIVGGPTRAGWWNDRVFYEVFVRSFNDHDGDGIGDISGLIDKLDYLNDGDPKTTTDLGVTGLWLMPMHPSPSYHGYDITDYYGINPQYGTLDDFRRLISECHKRGVNVILDLVLNHCSSKHPWFLEAANTTNPPSPKRDWFIWSDTDPKWKGPWGQRVWHKRSGDSPTWYYGLFTQSMPDLNYRNPAVSDEMLRVVDFWIDKEHHIGADGYRLDAVRHLIEDGQVQENTRETHDWLKLFHAECRKANPEAMSIGEVWTSSQVASSYVGSELDMTFEFDLAAAMVESVRTGVARPLIDAQARVLRCYPPNQYGRFLTNHDQTRVLTQLKGDSGAMGTAAALLLLGPGVPFIYYGEEIGMIGDKPDENLRRPMRWDDKANFGFTTGKPWEPTGFEQRDVNVQAESRDPHSLLSLYRDLIAFRSRTPAVASGGFWPIDASNPGVYAFVREGPTPAEPGRPRDALLVVMNLSGRPIEAAALSAKTSPFRGACTLRTNPLRAGPDPIDAPPLQASAEGAFTGYALGARLEPRQVRIFRLVDSK